MTAYLLQGFKNDLPADFFDEMPAPPPGKTYQGIYSDTFACGTIPASYELIDIPKPINPFTGGITETPETSPLTIKYYPSMKPEDNFMQLIEDAGYTPAFLERWKRLIPAEDTRSIFTVNDTVSLSNPGKRIDGKVYNSYVDIYFPDEARVAFTNLDDLEVIEASEPEGPTQRTGFYVRHYFDRLDMMKDIGLTERKPILVSERPDFAPVDYKGEVRRVLRENKFEGWARGEGGKEYNADTTPKEVTGIARDTDIVPFYDIDFEALADLSYAEPRKVATLRPTQNNHFKDNALVSELFARKVLDLGTREAHQIATPNIYGQITGTVDNRAFTANPGDAKQWQIVGVNEAPNKIVEALGQMYDRQYTGERGEFVKTQVYPMKEYIVIPGDPYLGTQDAVIEIDNMDNIFTENAVRLVSEENFREYFSDEAIAQFKAANGGELPVVSVYRGNQTTLDRLKERGIEVKGQLEVFFMPTDLKTVPAVLANELGNTDSPKRAALVDAGMPADVTFSVEDKASGDGAETHRTLVVRSDTITSKEKADEVMNIIRDNFSKEPNFSGVLDPYGRVYGTPAGEMEDNPVLVNSDKYSEFLASSTSADFSHGYFGVRVEVGEVKVTPKPNTDGYKAVIGGVNDVPYTPPSAQTQPSDTSYYPGWNPYHPVDDGDVVKDEE